MSLYRNIIKKAINNTWQNRYLWFFGLFAALLIGSGSEFSILYRGLSGESQGAFFPGIRSIMETGVFSAQTIPNLGRLFMEEPFSVIMIMLVGTIVLILFAFLVWLTIISQAALVNNSALIIGKKKNNFQDGINAGMKNFWSVFSLNLIVRLFVYIIFLLVSLPLILSAGRNVAGSNLAFGILFLLFIPVAVALSFIIKYAIAYSVIKRTDIFESIKLGWDLFAKNWIISLEMAFLLFFINFVAGFLIIVSLLILAVPVLFLGFILLKVGAGFAFGLVMMLGFFLFLAAIGISGALLATFQISAWTGLFIELISKGGASKLSRLMSNLQSAK